MSDSYVVCLNTGSSSLKFDLYKAGDLNKAIMVGSVENIGGSDSRVEVKLSHMPLMGGPVDIPNYEKAVAKVLSALSQAQLQNPIACVHRVVHGGTNLIRPTFIDEKVRAELERLQDLAPLHIPHEIETIRAATKAFPKAQQIACFDTAFHQRMPDLAKRLPIPRRFFQEGIHRYGFHGLSYESIVSQIGHELKGRSIVAHLGSGSSMVALKDRVPQDTTMGLTPTGGLMMGTRSGDLDPGVLFYLMRNPTASSAGPVIQIEELLNDHSGLLGVSEMSQNMEKLLKHETTFAAAEEAIELYCHCAKKSVGSLATTLGGLDNLVFTGGIGERSPEIRKRICEDLSFMGILIDSDRNNSNASIISRPDALPSGRGCKIRVQRTNENLEMAKHAVRLLYQRFFHKVDNTTEGKAS